MTANYYLPPEWVEQSGVMITWPHHENTWRPSLAEVEESFVAMAKHIADREKVLISCLSPEHLAHVKKCLEQAQANLSAIKLVVAPSNDVWARDHGPITVMSQDKIKLLDFKFNGWGNKYPSHRDNQITGHLYQQGVFDQIPIETIDVVLEGGSLEVDGKGTLLTTSSCLLAENRNPHLSKDELENLLKTKFNVQRVLWLDHGYLAGDDTDGHIDTLARFTDPETICYVSCDDPLDEHYEELKAMEAQLKTFTTLDGKPYRLVPLPWPGAKLSEEGDRLPATYANFLIINDAVLMPTYDDPADAKALEQLQSCFPSREVIGVPCRWVIEQYGSLHCVTMQLPKGVLA
jgi:agmatine deiminase